MNLTPVNPIQEIRTGEKKKSPKILPIALALGIGVVVWWVLKKRS